LAEIFKPILADRLIFKLLNNRQVQEKHFRKELNFCYLEESGRKVVLQEYDERLKTTIKHRGLGRNVCIGIWCAWRHISLSIIWLPGRSTRRFARGGKAGSRSTLSMAPED